MLDKLANDIVAEEVEQALEENREIRDGKTFSQKSWDEINSRFVGDCLEICNEYDWDKGEAHQVFAERIAERDKHDDGFKWVLASAATHALCNEVTEKMNEITGDSE